MERDVTSWQLIAVGDVHPNSDDPSSAFDFVIHDLEDGALRIAQLECTISELGDVRSDVRNPTHRVRPHNALALEAGRFNVITYAGNNNLDFGPAAFLDTIRRLREMGISVVGGGSDLQSAEELQIITVNGNRVGFLDWCAILPPGSPASASGAGVSPVRVATFYEPLENLREQPGTPSRTVTWVTEPEVAHIKSVVAAARERVDLLVVAFHWGVHFTHDLAMYQPYLGRAAIDAGAELVIGTHPHCLQPIEVYHGKYICYSLGNFLFQQYGAQSRPGVASYLSMYGLSSLMASGSNPHPEHCRLSAIAKFEVHGAEVVGLELVPVWIRDDGRPERTGVGHPRYEEVLSLVEDLCHETGVQVERTTSANGTLRVGPQQAFERDLVAWMQTKYEPSYPWLDRLRVQAATRQKSELRSSSG